MFKNWICVGALLAVSALSCSLFAASPDDFEVLNGPSVPGQLYVPPEAAESPRPLVLFLHGAGETGRNNRGQINGNIDNLLNASKDRGAFLYAPQATTVSGGIYNWDDMERTDTVMAVINGAIDEYNIDPDRVYITGLSMGGGGTWNMSSRYPERFAAAVPIAGVRAASDFDPSVMLEVPSWAFHARNDGVITKQRSRDRVNEMLVAAGEPTIDSFPANDDSSTTFEYQLQDLETGTDIQYTELPTGGHGIWGGVYNMPEVFDWMFAKSRVGDPYPTGDYNSDRGVGVHDLDLLIAAINDGSNEARFDLNGNGVVDVEDRDEWLSTFEQSLVGDANLDGTVDSGDLNIVGLNWQSDSVSGWAQGDFNGDGKVNSSDLNDVGRNWRVSGAAAAPASVPEPNGTLLAMLALVGLLARRRDCLS